MKNKRDTSNTDRTTIRVREIRLNDTEKDYEEEPVYRKRNTELKIVSYIFILLFLLLAGYLIYFNVAKRKEISSSVYNTRQDENSDRIIRGSILTQDGTQLAYTSVDMTGNETRVYPYYNVFSHVIGYATNGKGGLEATANNQLMQSHSPLLEQLENASNAQKVQGDSVIVTLDPKLQQAAYNALGSYRGAVVVMEPGSGKILAMVSKPDFDPNTISENWEAMVGDQSQSALLNRASSGLYPPGSTFKILTTLSYMRQNQDTWQDFAFDCNGILNHGDVTITCYGSEVHGHETLKDAFLHSCNTAYATIGLNFDTNEFRKTVESFLFNKKLPTELQHSKSVFSLENSSSDGEKMTTAIGQGNTLVTPLHMAMIASTVANGGIMMKPYYIAGVQTYDGTVVSTVKPEIYDELMTIDEAEALTADMQAVVEQGTGYGLSQRGYTVAGKTGSAEYETNGQTGTHSWFVGFSNVEDPDLAIAVIAEDGGTGSSAAVPIAAQIFDTYYWG